MLVSISRTLTRPIETLVEGTRALALGNFDYRLSEDGAEEIRELSRAFERMRIQLQRTQNELLDSERLATIGGWRVRSPTIYGTISPQCMLMLSS